MALRLPASPERWARIGVSVLFLALVRTLLEYFRLKYVQGAAFDPAAAEPYVVGGVIAAVLCWVAVLLCFAGRHRAALGVEALTIGVLLAYKLYALG